MQIPDPIRRPEEYRGPTIPDETKKGQPRYDPATPPTEEEIKFSDVDPGKVEQLSEEELISLAQQNKIKLIEILGVRTLKIGTELALVNAEYFRQKNTRKEDNFGELAYKHAQLEVLMDAIKHTLSALQSTLRAERPY